MTDDPKHTGFYRPDIADSHQESANGILLPGFDCSNPSCRGWTGLAKENHKVCRFCGAPRPINLEKTMLENLTHVQARCTELLLENRELKQRIAVAEKTIEMLLNTAAARPRQPGPCDLP
jgi:hypothetical protein